MPSRCECFLFTATFLLLRSDQRVARRLLSSEPSLASVGNLAFMPRYDAVKSGVGGSR